MVAEYMPPEQAETPNVQDPHLMVQCPAEPDKMRAQHHNGIFVTRTRDGGLTFDKLTQGLPQVDAYDIVFRHALDVDETGQRPAFGSTTGSLWISEDQGDSWTTLSRNLPPVYSLIFS